jgi:hypothetical protein
MHPTNQLRGPQAGAKPTEPSPYGCTTQLEASSPPSCSHRCPWVPWSARKLASWSSGILQACPSAAVVVPIGSRTQPIY